jgi:hypothetical protein
VYGKENNDLKITEMEVKLLKKRGGCKLNQQRGVIQEINKKREDKRDRAYSEIMVYKNYDDKRIAENGSNLNVNSINESE